MSRKTIRERLLCHHCIDENELVPAGRGKHSCPECGWLEYDEAPLSWAEGEY